MLASPIEAHGHCCALHYNRWTDTSLNLLKNWFFGLFFFFYPIKWLPSLEPTVFFKRYHFTDINGRILYLHLLLFKKMKREKFSFYSKPGFFQYTHLTKYIIK